MLTKLEKNYKEFEDWIVAIIFFSLTIVFEPMLGQKEKKHLITQRPSFFIQLVDDWRSGAEWRIYLWFVMAEKKKQETIPSHDPAARRKQHDWKFMGNALQGTQEHRGFLKIKAMTCHAEGYNKFNKYSGRNMEV